jgi:hypothetical protein
MLAGAFSCHHLNAHRSDEYIVPEASDGDLTDAACSSKMLLVEQQVSLSLYGQRPKQTYKRLSTSHHACLPKVVAAFYLIDMIILDGKSLSKQIETNLAERVQITMST